MSEKKQFNILCKHVKFKLLSKFALLFAVHNLREAAASCTQFQPQQQQQQHQQQQQVMVIVVYAICVIDPYTMKGVCSCNQRLFWKTFLAHLSIMCSM